jgi:hypothetical protein
VTEIVGTAEHYAEFVRLCRSRIEALGLTFDSVDALSGFGVGSRYTAILLSGGKAMSVFSFFTLARTLALTPQFAHDETQLAELKKRTDWIEMRRKGAKYRPHRSGGAVKFTNHIDFYRQIGRKGALAWNTERRRRKAAARHAIMTRWHGADYDRL